jgi:hypothetical protein
MSVLLFHDSTRSHTGVHTTEAMTKCGCTALLNPPYSSYLAPLHFYLSGPLKDSLWGHHYMMTRHCSTPCARCCRDRTTAFTGCQYMLMLNAEEEYWQTRRLHWKIIVFSSKELRFCEISTHLTCKQHEIKNRRLLCLTNPCIYTQKKRNVKAVFRSISVRCFFGFLSQHY